MEVRYHEIRCMRRGHFVQPTMHLLMTCTDPSFSLYLDLSLSLSRLPHLEMCISTCQIMACVLNGNLRERSNYIIRKTERNEDELPNRATHQPTSNQAKDNINQQSLHTLTETCTNRELKQRARVLEYFFLRSRKTESSNTSLGTMNQMRTNSQYKLPKLHPLRCIQNMSDPHRMN
jgi:hypothetical protein